MGNYGKAVSLCIGSLLFLSACSTTLEINQLRQSQDLSSRQSVELTEVPFFPQEEYQCGPAALAMLLNWSGLSLTPHELVPLVYVPERQGSFQVEMIAAVRHYDRIPYVINPGLRNLFTEVEAGNPVLVFQNLGLNWFPRWHYAVVTGVDFANNNIILHSGTIEKHVMSIDTFERTWQRADKWAMVVLEPGKLPASAEPFSYTRSITYFESKGKLELARQAYLAATERWPASQIVYMGLGNVSYHLHQLSQAEQYYLKVIEIDNGYAPAHNNLAQVLLEKGQLESARMHAETAIRLGGEHGKAYQETLNQIDHKLRDRLD